MSRAGCAARYRPGGGRRCAGRLCASRPGALLPSAQLTSQATAPVVAPSLDARPSQTAVLLCSQTGGTLIAARTAEATDLDPQLTSSLARQRITMLTYNNLVKLSSEVAIQPDLAETWKVSADGKQIDFTLRKGVIWHPPVSREADGRGVKFSYERLLRESPGKSDLPRIEASRCWTSTTFASC